LSVSMAGNMVRRSAGALRAEENQIRRQVKHDVADLRRPPMPTDLSDVGHVLAWADRHTVEWAAEGDASQMAEAAAEAAARVSAEEEGEMQTRNTTAARRSGAVSFADSPGSPETLRSPEAPRSPAAGAACGPKPSLSRSSSMQQLEEAMRDEGTLQGGETRTLWEKQMVLLHEASAHAAGRARQEVARHHGNAITEQAGALTLTPTLTPGLTLTLIPTLTLTLTQPTP